MAVNDSRSMTTEFVQGTVDSTYIALTPDRGVVENPPVDRLDWPQYARAELDADPPFGEAHTRRAMHPVEYKTSQTRAAHGGFGSDPRA
jgi:hypothetical protein